MKSATRTLIAGVAVLALGAGSAVAQDHGDHGGAHGGDHGGDHGGRPAGDHGGGRQGGPQAGGEHGAPGAPGRPPGGGRQGAPVAPGSGGYRSGGAQRGGPPVAPGSGGYRGGGESRGGPPVAPGSGGYRSGAETRGGPGAGGYHTGGGRFGSGGDRGARGFEGGRGRAGGRSFSYHGVTRPAFRSAPFRYPRGYAYRRYDRGARLPFLFLSPNYYLSDYADFYLAPPPYVYERWIRYGPDALLVDTRSGQVIDVAYGVFDDGAGDYGGGYGSDEDGPPPYSAPY